MPTLVILPSVSFNRLFAATWNILFVLLHRWYTNAFRQFKADFAELFLPPNAANTAAKGPRQRSLEIITSTAYTYLSMERKDKSMQDEVEIDDSEEEECLHESALQEATKHWSMRGRSFALFADTVLLRINLFLWGPQSMIGSIEGLRRDVNARGVEDLWISPNLNRLFFLQRAVEGLDPWRVYLGGMTRTAEQTQASLVSELVLRNAFKDAKWNAMTPKDNNAMTLLGVAERSSALAPSPMKVPANELHAWLMRLANDQRTSKTRMHDVISQIQRNARAGKATVFVTAEGAVKEARMSEDGALRMVNDALAQFQADTVESIEHERKQHLRQQKQSQQQQQPVTKSPRCVLKRKSPPKTVSAEDPTLNSTPPAKHPKHNDDPVKRAQVLEARLKALKIKQKATELVKARRLARAVQLEQQEQHQQPLSPGKNEDKNDDKNEPPPPQRDEPSPFLPTQSAGTQKGQNAKGKSTLDRKGGTWKCGKGGAWRKSKWEKVYCAEARAWYWFNHETEKSEWVQKKVKPGEQTRNLPETQAEQPGEPDGEPDSRRNPSDYYGGAYDDNDYYGGPRPRKWSAPNTEGWS